MDIMQKMIKNYCKEGIKDLYTYTVESTKFINPQALTVVAPAHVLQPQAFRFINFVYSLHGVHTYKYYLLIMYKRLILLITAVGISFTKSRYTVEKQAENFYQC